MKNTVSFLIISLLALSGISFSQTKPSEYEKVAQVYTGLEYNTISFNDLKQKWVISDPLLVREIFNRFVVRGALRSGGNKITSDLLKQKIEDIYKGSVIIDLRKRYYDDEIEFFAFTPEGEMQKKNPNYLFDPVADPFLLRDIVGEKVYEKIKEQGYFYSNITKTTYDTKNGYFYDLYLNLLEPRVMFWSTTSAARNKYLISAFGKWGSDEIMYPGWFLGEYVVGGSLTFFESISSDQRKYLYDLKIGTALPSSRPFLGDFGVGQGKKLLQPSGQSVYLKASGDVLKYFMDGADGYYLSIEAKYSINEFKVKEFTFSGVDTLYSVRDYICLSVTKRDLVDLGDLGSLAVGGGIATSDIYRYQLDKNNSKIVDIDKNKSFTQKYIHNVFAEVGVSRTGGLIQHDISLMVNGNTDGYGAVGVKAQFMLSDQFGVDFRIMKGFGLDAKKQPYRSDSYVVFSPILRINY